MNYKKEISFGLHLGFGIAKLAMQAAMVAGVYCLAHEAHKIHKTLKKEERIEAAEEK